MKLLMSTKSIANAVGGKTARACDSCVRKRARWYCAADDAFLCQSCDSTVHSANPLARRHQRLRLNSSTSSNPPDNSPSWVSGFTRKPRSRRPRRKSESDEVGLSSLVPEADEDNNEDQELLLYRVPTFDPFVVEENQSKSSVVGESWANNLHGSSFLPSDLDLADFAADVESLLGRNLESECFDMEGLGLGRVVKLEEEQQRRHTHTNHNSCRHVPVQQFEAGLDPFQFNFEDYDHDQKLTVVGVKNERQHQDYSSTAAAADQDNNRKVLLRLDCDAIIAAWGNHKSPWTTGERPDFDPDQSWPHSMAICGSVRYGQTCGEYGVSTAAVGDGGREARVSRYREKRRTRLFSKKIRYEVRKLNAEKRPRMKGRFVKRTSSFTLPIISIN